MIGRILRDVVPMCRLWLLGLVIFLNACSTHFDTSKREGTEGYTIYRLSQEEAFAIAYKAIVTILPGRKISKIDGPVKGFSTWSRFVLDTYTQQVIVIPMKGTTKDGKTVEGFSFEVSGSGTSGSGRATNVSLYKTIQENLNQMNVGAIVSRLERGAYTNPVFGKTHNPSETLPSSSATVEERLKELKRLFEQGLISQKEYQDKRTVVIESL